MPLPEGVLGYYPLTNNRLLVGGSLGNFPCQYDASSLLLNPFFKGLIRTRANIGVYDPLSDTVRPSVIKLDLLSNKLLISFDGALSTSENRVFLICVGPTLLYVDSSSAFSNSEFVHRWGINEFSPGATTVDDVGGQTGNVISPATIGNVGIFGSCAKDFGADGNINYGDVIALNSATKLSVELLFKKDSMSTTAIFFRKYANSSNNFSIQNSAPSLRVYVSNGAAAFGTFSIASLSTNVWHHLFIVFNGSGSTNSDRLKVYLNGVLQSMSFNGTIPASLPNLSLSTCYLGFTSVSFDGSLDENSILNNIKDVNFILSRHNQFLNTSFWAIGPFVSLIKGPYFSLSPWKFGF